MISSKELFQEISNQCVCEGGEVVGYFVKNSRMNLLENLLSAPAVQAGQEPIYQLRDVDWYDTDKRTYDTVVNTGGAGRIVYAAPQLPQPAPVAVPDEMEMDDDFDSAFEHGKAVGWNACRAAMLTAAPAAQPEQEPVGIIRYVDIGLPDKKGIHATFYTPLPEGTELFSRPAQAEQTKRLIGWRAADYTEETSDPEMAKNWAAVVGVLPVFEGDINTRLQAEQLSGNTEQVSQPVLPATQFKPVADLYEMQFDDGRTFAFHTDPEKAIQWLNTCGGNKVQEYVKLERLQDAITDNSPAIPDGWIPVSERMPEFNDEVLVWHRHGFPMLAVYGACKDPITYKTYRCLRDNDGEIDATHWQPLPAAPKMEAE